MLLLHILRKSRFPPGKCLSSTKGPSAFCSGDEKEFSTPGVLVVDRVKAGVDALNAYCINTR